MARIKLGLHVADMRGKVGQLVYSIWKAGVSYVRLAAQVVRNPNSARQADARSCFGRLSRQWMTKLTPMERAAWDDWAGLKPRCAPDQGGARILIKRNRGVFAGKNAYGMANILLNSAGLPEVTRAPMAAVPPSAPANLAGTFDGTKFILTFTPPRFYKPGAKVRVFCQPERGKYFHRQQAATGFAADGRVEVSSVRGSQGTEIFASRLPAGIYVFFQLDTIDPDGTSSESTAAILVKVE